MLVSANLELVYSGLELSSTGLVLVKAGQCWCSWWTSCQNSQNKVFQVKLKQQVPAG